MYVEIAVRMEIVEHFWQLANSGIWQHARNHVHVTPGVLMFSNLFPDMMVLVFSLQRL